MDTLTLQIPEDLRQRADLYRKAAEEPSQLVKDTLELAEHHQKRLRLHTTPKVQCKVDTSDDEAVKDFADMVKAQIAEDKYHSFMSLLRYPLCTNAIVAKVWDKLGRVLEAKNKKLDYSFTDDSYYQDYQQYKAEIGLKDFVTKLFNFCKTEINGIVVVDMAGQADGRVRPYPYLVPSHKVIDFKSDHDGRFEYVIYRVADRVVVCDESAYYTFENKDGKPAELLGVSQHYLGYTPARWVWTDSLNGANPNLKQSPITAALELLDWYLFYVTASKSLMVSGAYPIYSGYAANCNYVESDGTYCDNGYLKNAQGEYLFDSNSPNHYKPCPICGTKRIAGPGAYVEIPVPDANTPDMRNPVQMLSVDKNALDFSVTKKAQLEQEIVSMCVGSDTEVMDDSAINEKQVEATFESQTAVLLRLKKAYESVITFIESTICALRYDEDFKGMKADLGDEYFLQSVDSLRDEYAKAKADGAPMAELALLQDRIYNKELANNDKEKARQRILGDLEPLKGLTIAEISDLYDRGLVSKENFLLKINFAELISKFERINGKITIFGAKNEDYDKVLENITNELKKYLKDGTEDRAEETDKVQV